MSALQDHRHEANRKETDCCPSASLVPHGVLLGSSRSSREGTPREADSESVTQVTFAMTFSDLHTESQNGVL
jgi:hypothetical protein